MRSSDDIQCEIDVLESLLAKADECETMSIKSRLYDLNQQRKNALSEEAKRQYQEAGWF